MYFLTFQYKGVERIGVMRADKKSVIPIEDIIHVNPPSNMIELIKGFDRYGDIIKSHSLTEGGVDLSEVKISAPIPEPIRNIICVGKNYRDHIKEVAKTIDEQNTIPSYPMYFSKMIDRILGPEDSIPSHSDITNKLDYESELAVVIGKDGHDIPEDKAEEYIFGYTILNDISVRDVQRRHVQWFKGKSMDGTCAMGPYIVHKSAVPYPPELNIGSRVNSELRQNSNTREFIFSLAYLISDFSKGLTLRAGDVISTGTPSGVGMGFDPPKFLRHGDIVECFIDNIGVLKNTVD